MHLMRSVVLSEGEQLRFFIRRQSLFLIVRVIFAFIFLLIDFFLLVPLFRIGFWGIIIFIAILCGIFLYTIRSILVWKYTMFLITNERLISVIQKGLFERMVTECDLTEINDITYAKKGIFATLFHFGTVCVQCTKDGKSFTLPMVDHPEKVHNDLLSVSKRNFDKDIQRDKKDLRAIYNRLGSEKFTELVEKIENESLS